MDKNILKINIRRTPINMKSKTYMFNMDTFESGYPEAILRLLNNFNKAVPGTRTTSPIVNFTFLRNLLRFESLRKYKLIISTNWGTTANNLLDISNGITKYLFPSNVLTKKASHVSHDA